MHAEMFHQRTFHEKLSQWCSSRPNTLGSLHSLVWSQAGLGISASLDFRVLGGDQGVPATDQHQLWLGMGGLVDGHLHVHCGYSQGVFTLGDVDCKSEVHVNFEVRKNQSKLFFDIDYKVAVIAVKNTH